MSRHMPGPVPDYRYVWWFSSLASSLGNWGSNGCNTRSLAARALVVEYERRIAKAEQ